jgi:hypothetical protein
MTSFIGQSDLKPWNSDEILRAPEIFDLGVRSVLEKIATLRRKRMTRAALYLPRVL